MDYIDKSASQILLEAAELLTEEGSWHKIGFFRAKNDGDFSKGCSVCAHGAIAYCGNPFVKDSLSSGKYPGGTFYRPSAQGDEVNIAHHKANQVGLTFNYNDDPATTQQDVINKLREAAALP